MANESAVSSVTNPIDADAVGQAALVASGHVSPLELVDAAIARVEQLNPVVNAVVHDRFEQARRQATAPLDAEVPFAGVPFLLKDGGTAQAGVPKTRGNGALKAINFVPDADEPLGARFRGSGLITIGATNMPEFGQLGVTQPLAFGPTRNPWDVQRSPAGSSGGAGAAVAAGMVAVAHAGDAGGSIRAPGSWCGVIGLKPSRGRVPRVVGSIEDIWTSEFVICRTTRDAAMVLDAIHGPTVGGLYVLPRNPEPYARLTTQAPDVLRIGLMLEPPPWIRLHPECRAAVEAAGVALEEAGHRVEIAAPAALHEPIPPEVNDLHGADLFIRCVATLERLLGRPVLEEDVEPYTWYRSSLREPLSADEFRYYIGWHLGRAARVLQWWSEGFDILVAPTVSEPPPLLSERASQSLPEIAAAERVDAVYLEPFNASGQPAVSLPIHVTSDGLPVGAQFVANRGREDLLLQLAAQLEPAVGWTERRPNLSAVLAAGRGDD